MLQKKAIWAIYIRNGYFQEGMAPFKCPALPLSVGCELDDFGFPKRYSLYCSSNDFKVTAHHSWSHCLLWSM